MSYTEKHIGKLKEVDFDRNGTTSEQFYKMLCQYHGYNDLTVENKYTFNTYRTWEELYWDNLWDADNMYRVDGRLYKLTDHTEIDESKDMFLFHKNADGTISFAVEFYNGGTCLNEMIEEGIRSVNNK